MNIFVKTLDSILVSISKHLNKKFQKNIKNEPLPEGMKEYLDLSYKNRKGEPLTMDVYEPTNTKTPDLPVIIYIHGGGLVLGDKVMSRGFCIELAKRGFLVFALNYKLAPICNVYDQFDDVADGMDFVGEKIIDFNVNPFRIYLVAESAGAYLSIYAAAMSKSKKIQEAICRTPTRMRYKAMVLIGGMFYTKRNDLVGRTLMRYLYRDTAANKAMMPYLDPENKEVAGNLPPCMLVTSEHDFLRKYTERLCGILWNYNVPYHFVYMGDEKRINHAFPVLHPKDPASQKVLDITKEWLDRY